jgi:hypothetical protein
VDSIEHLVPSFDGGDDFLLVLGPEGACLFVGPAQDDGFRRPDRSSIAGWGGHPPPGQPARQDDFLPVRVLSFYDWPNDSFPYMTAGEASPAFMFALDN